MSKYDAGFELSWYDKFKAVCALLPRVGKVLQEGEQMKKHFRTMRLLAAIAFVLLGLASGAVTAEAKDMDKISKAKDLIAGETYTLTDNTILTMDKDLTLKQIKGNYDLTILGNGTLTLTGVNSDYALKVKKLTINEAGITIDSDKGNVYGLYANDTVIDKGTINIKIVGEEYQYGFIIQGPLDVKNESKVNVETKISNAIQVNGALTVSGSTVNAKSDARIGMRSSEILKIKDGSSITASGGSHGIFTVTSMTISGDDTHVNTEGGSGYGLYSDTGSISIEDNAVVTAVDDGVAAETFISVVNAELHSNSKSGSAAIVFNGSTSTPVSFINSNVVLVSEGYYGFRTEGSDGNHVYIEGSTVSIKSKNDSIRTNMSFDIVKSKVDIVSSDGIGICSGLGVDTIMDSDVAVSGKTYGIVTDKTLTIKDSTVKASVTGTGSSDMAIVSQNGELSCEKTNVFIKTPENGRVKKLGSGQTINDKDGKPAKNVEIVKATALKEIWFEFPTVYDGDPIISDFKVTTVPAGAIRNDKCIEYYKQFEASGDLSTRFAASADNKKYTQLKKTETKYEIDKYYGTNIPGGMSLLLALQIVADLEDTSTNLFDRNVIQSVASDIKLYINGVELSKATVDGWYVIGRCLGNIKKAKIDDIAAQEYTGKALTPEPVVTYNGKTLKKDTDYTLTYKDNIGDPNKKTTATVTVTGKGSYALSADKTFEIEHTKHVKDTGKVVKDPTVKKTGSREYHCTLCGKLLETETIAKLKADAPLSPDTAPTLEKTEKAIVKITGMGDPKGSKFSLLQAKARKIGKNYVTLGWTKVDGAEQYIIYGNKCGKKNKYLKITTAKASATAKKIAKISGKALKKGTYYKFIIAAVAKDSEGVDKVIATSKSVHFITKGNAKYGDFTKVTLKTPKSVKIKKGKKYKIKAVQVKPKKLKVSQHRTLSFESNNIAVATITKDGVVKGVGKGKAVIYVYAQNGLFATVSVTVK